MISARLRTTEEIFYSALEQKPDQRGVFLDTACAGDTLLRAELEALLAAYEPARDFIETPAINLAAKILGEAQPDLRAGLRIGHYELCQPIGAGGMGEVYLAIDTIAGRQAALKLLPLRFTGEPERLRRFEQEARAVVALNHPNIVTIYEIGEDRSTHFIASELINGETLRVHLERGPVEVDAVLDVAIQVASALAAAHEAGVIHRDIKPENIMLRPDGYVKVLDFGIAKLAEIEPPVTMAGENAPSVLETHVTSVAGTARYMSPEQTRGAAIDRRTDIWSLGVVLYEMLAGRAPFTGESTRAVMTAIVETEPPPLPSARAELQPIITKALRKSPNERYASARELSEALKLARRRLEAMPASRMARRAVIAALLLIVLIAAALFFQSRKDQSAPSSAVAARPASTAQKSIAVLPFENLSRDPENAYFADGVQDEILTNLAKIADLKVISRMSVLPYKEKAVRNLPAIAQQLGVAHLLEGSVQRSGNRVRVNAQLIATSTGSHEWAETYDRELADVFAIQGEIATAIAQQLQAKISPGEKAAIGVAPTTDLLANALYQQAKAMELTEPLGSQTLLVAVRLLDQAVARDPQFVLAYCLLGRVHTSLFYGLNRSPAQRELANVALQNASRLQPDSGEVHRSWAYYAYYGFFDYDRARAELDLARRTLPNDAEVYHLTALLDRRQGRWNEAVRNFERAAELDPGNFQHLFLAGAAYHAQRRYSECRRLWGRGLRIEPRDLDARIFRASVPFNERADRRPLRAELSAILAEEPANAGKVAADLVRCALAERDSAATTRALDAIPAGGIKHNLIDYPPAWFAGLVARTFGDHDAARVSFLAARAEVEKLVLARPDNADAWSLLGRIDAALGRREDALREGRRACELMPVSKNADGVHFVTDLAVVYAWLGENDLALEQLAISARLPAGVYYGGLKLDPQWDSLRGDPRFEKIVAALAPARL